MDRTSKHAVAIVALLSATVFGQTSSHAFDHGIELLGTVNGMHGQANCAVELSRLRGFGAEQQASCDMNGSFQFTRVPRGVYNLVVKVGAREYTEEVSLVSPLEQVEIQIPTRKPADGNGSTVSVAEMRMPDKAKDELQKANRALAKGKLDQADEYAQKALAMAPQFARAVTLRAVILMARKDFKSALQLTDSAAQMDPMLALTQVVRASALNSMGRAREAQAAAEQGVRLGASWQGHFELARALMTQRQFKQALGEITKAMAMAPPQFADLMLLRASALFNLKDVSGARDALAAFLKERPGDPRGTRMMAALNAR